MSHIPIARIREAGSERPSLLTELKELTERIRERAFAIFQRRGSAEGSALNDWLQAEQDLMLGTESDLVEKDSKYYVAITVPGFAEKGLKVTALPDTLVVRGESKHRREKHEGDIHFSELGEKTLFRRFDLPEAIDVDKVTAQLDKGVLRVTATKAQQQKVVARAAG
jgi:HSP20 family molecular chaperone IbpA